MILAPTMPRVSNLAIGGVLGAVSGGTGRPNSGPSSHQPSDDRHVQVKTRGHRRNPPLGSFPTQPTGVNFVATITTMQRGRPKCANSLSSPSFFFRLLAACRTPIRVALAALSQGLSQLTRWTKTWSLARPSAHLLALRPAASISVCRPAAHATKLGVASARPTTALETTYGDSPMGGFFVSARVRSRDPEEVTCSRRS